MRVIAFEGCRHVGDVLRAYPFYGSFFGTLDEKNHSVNRLRNSVVLGIVLFIGKRVDLS